MVALELGLGIAALALVCEYVDSTLGMGYGTTLTPLLLIAGFEPLQVVPVVLLSELITGFFAAWAHHRVGNVDLRRNSLHFRVAMVLGACSVVGAVGAVLIAVSLPAFYVQLYIGVLVVAMGLIILWKRNGKRAFSWPKIVGLGALAAFNKGISGGGYGPLVTSGQMLSGVNGKNAVGITSLAEAFTCLVGVAVYVAANHMIDWQLAPFLIAGAVVSVPVSALTVKRIDMGGLTVVIGAATLVLGAFTLWKLFS